MALFNQFKTLQRKNTTSNRLTSPNWWAFAGETIVNLERGKYNPSLKLAMDIARVFHTTVEELFQYTDE